MKIFRWSGIIILLIVSALIWALITIWVNIWLDKSIEQGGGELNGATVDLESVSMAWLLNGITLEQLAIADPNNLERNRLEIGEIDFAISLSSLLQSKLHVEKLVLTDLRFDQPRQQPAKTIAATKLTDASQWEWPKATAAKLQNIDPQAALAQVGLNSPSLFSQFSDELSTLPNQWEDQRKGLPTEKTLSEFKQKSQTLKQRLKQANALEKVVVLKDVRAFVKEVEQEKKKLSTFKNQVSQDISSARSRYKQLEVAIDDDVKLARSVINLSPEGIDHLAARLLGENLAYWVKLVFAHSDKLRKTSVSDTQVEPLPRTGIDVALDNEPVLPRLWIDEAVLSGDVSVLKQQGVVKGSLVNLGSALLQGKPVNGKVEMTFDAPTGKAAPSSLIEFSAKRIESDVAAQGIINVSNWPIANWTLANGDIVLANLNVNSQLNWVLDRASTNVTITMQLSDFNIEKSEGLNKSLTQFIEVIEQAERVDIRVGATQIKDKVDITLQSNLDKLFSQKIKQRINLEIKKVEASLREAIESKTLDARGKIEQQLAQLLDTEALIKQQLANLDTVVDF